MANLNSNVLGIEFENPFILASAPPTASIESIDKAFELGWGALQETPTLYHEFVKNSRIRMN